MAVVSTHLSTLELESKKTNRLRLFFNWRRRQELGMLIFASLIVFGAYVIVSLAKSSKLPTYWWGFLAAIVILGLIAHLGVRIFAPRADSVILPVVFLLNGLGYVVIARLDENIAHHFAPYQAAWSAIGVGCFILTLAVIKRLRDLDRFRYIMLSAAVLLLISPLIPKIGYSENGARLWIHLPGLTFQPVELAKILFVVFLASYFAEKKEMLSIGTKRIGNFLVPDPRSLAPVVIAFFFTLGTMGIEDDIGFALLFFVVFISLIWLATGRSGYLIAGIVLFFLAMVVAQHIFPQVNERFQAWLHPYRFANTIGYQPIQSTIAFGFGGIGGMGLGLGYPNFIPVANSDFIFAVFAEETGLFGALSIITAFLILLGAGFRAALASRSDFTKLLIAGLTLTLAFQSFFIIAGILRILPLTGITLPFVSYGGSSLVANYIVIAIIIKASHEANDFSSLRNQLLLLSSE